MSYCEDEALHFDSAIPVDRAEPELVLASEPVRTQVIRTKFRATVLWDDCTQIIEGEEDWVLPMPRAPPERPTPCYETLFGALR